MTQQEVWFNTFDTKSGELDYKEQKWTDYSYWLESDKLDAQVALRNLPVFSWNYASWYGSRLSSAWIWQVTIPVWFTAKLVKIRAVLAWWEWAWSEWTYNWTWDWICIYWYNQNWWYYSWSSYDTTKIIYIRNYNWNTTRATLFVSWTNMYLDFWTMNVDVFYIWEAFG